MYQSYSMCCFPLFSFDVFLHILYIIYIYTYTWLFNWDSLSSFKTTKLKKSCWLQFIKGLCCDIYTADSACQYELGWGFIWLFPSSAWDFKVVLWKHLPFMFWHTMDHFQVMTRTSHCLCIECHRKQIQSWDWSNNIYISSAWFLSL